MNAKTYLCILAFFFFFSSQTSAYLKADSIDFDKAETFKGKLNSGEFSISTAAFTENKGQVKGYDGSVHAEVKFSFQQGCTQVFLLEKGIAYQFTKVHYPKGYQEGMRDKFSTDKDFTKMQSLQNQIRTETFRMDMTLVGANKNARITTEGKSVDYTNFYNHNVLDVHSYSKITYHDIYPGIDWVIYTKNNQIKYDFVVKPGVNPAIIKMAFTNQEGLQLNDDGSFTLKNSLGSVTEKKPVSFQGEKNIDTKFLLDQNILSFDLGNYSSNDTLVIDPALVWATYYGGTNGDLGFSCSIDAFGNIYLAGWTISTGNIASGGHQNSFSGGYWDAFLVKFNNLGVRLWGTYYGDVGDDYGKSCAVDASGNVYLAGTTTSTNNIASAGHQNVTTGNDAFLVKFNTAGIRQWCTYYGGAGLEEGYSCATDALGNVYLAGVTTSTNNIASAGHQNTFAGPLLKYDAFLVMFNSSGVRQWGTYYGGTATDYGYSCATDASGNIYLAGTTSSTNNIALAGQQNTINTMGNLYRNAFLAKFNSSGVRQWATYYGNLYEEGYSCATDASGNVYLAGQGAPGINMALGGHQVIFGGGAGDAFLVKFNSNGVRQWDTYYGGFYEDCARCCSVDQNGNVYLTGFTASLNNIASGGYQNTIIYGFHDAFMAKFNNAGVRLWGTYYGEWFDDKGYSCATDVSGNVYLAGATSSTVGIASGGHQNTLGGGGHDAFLVKFCENPAQPSIISGNTISCFGNTQMYSVPNTINSNAYNWSFSGTWTGNSSTNSITVVPLTSGIITVVAQNTCGASLPQTLSIVVNPTPTLTINSGTMCVGQSYTLLPSGALTYTYSGGSAVVSPNASTNYSISGSNNFNCVASTIATITVNALPTVIISSAHTSICAGQSTTLNASGAATYTWNNGFSGSSLIISPDVSTTYSLLGTDANDCVNTAVLTQNVDACVGITDLAKGAQQLKVFPNPSRGVFFVQTAEDANITVYNSLGQVVFYQKTAPGKNTINLSNKPNGIYFMRLENSETTVKLIKE